MKKGKREPYGDSNAPFEEEHALPRTSGQIFPGSAGVSPAPEAAKMAALPGNPRTVTTRDLRLFASQIAKMRIAARYKLLLASLECMHEAAALAEALGDPGRQGILAAAHIGCYHAASSMSQQEER